MSGTADLVFLLAGQSNMSGRGAVPSVEPVRSPQVRAWRSGRAEPAEDPLHDDPDAAAGLAMSFAADVADATGRGVLLVPSAVGGTSILRWLPGADLFVRAAGRWTEALAHGEAAGILWHQGEADSDSAESASAHAGRLARVIRGFRSVGGPAPFVAGELGGFVPRYPGCPYAGQVNAAIAEACRSEPTCAVVSADGLTDLGDDLHFDGPSLRTFGHRYAEAWLRLARG